MVTETETCALWTKVAPEKTAT